MRLLTALPLLLALAGCATQVTHATKSDAEMRADIKSCTAEADAEHGFDAIGTLRGAYACLDARGYQRARPGLAAGVERSVKDGRAATVAPAAGTPREPVRPCTIPCTRPNGP